jgi:hypothetical protein
LSPLPLEVHPSQGCMGLAAYCIPFLTHTPGTQFRLGLPCSASFSLGVFWGGPEERGLKTLRSFLYKWCDSNSSWWFGHRNAMPNSMMAWVVDLTWYEWIDNCGGCTHRYLIDWIVGNDCY